MQEIIKLKKIVPVPQMPDFCLGIINMRGTIIPVFDLRRKFLLPEKEFNNLTRLIIANVDNTRISFVVDEILNRFDIFII